MPRKEGRSKTKSDPIDILLNPTRFRIANLLNPTERSASELADELHIDVNLVGFHLTRMVKCGVLTGEYKKRLVQNRPFLIKYYTLTDVGTESMRKIRGQIDF